MAVEREAMQRYELVGILAARLVPRRLSSRAAMQTPCDVLMMEKLGYVAGVFGVIESHLCREN